MNPNPDRRSKKGRKVAADRTRTTPLLPKSFLLSLHFACDINGSAIWICFDSAPPLSMQHCHCGTVLRIEAARNSRLPWLLARIAQNGPCIQKGTPLPLNIFHTTVLTHQMVTVLHHEVFGIIRSLMPFRLAGSPKGILPPSFLSPKSSSC